MNAVHLRNLSARTLSCVIAVLLLCMSVSAQQGDGPRRTRPYPEEVVDAFRTLPVQEGGRIKPFDTVARFALLRMNEKRTLHLPDDPQLGELSGTTLSATEWALDVMLYPLQADGYPTFVIADRDVFDLIGLGEAAKRKRDRYSFDELLPGVQKLEQEFERYREIPEKERTRLQNQLVYLYNDLYEYSRLRSVFDAARIQLPLGESQILRAAFGETGEAAGAERQSVGFTEATIRLQTLMEAYRKLEQQAGSGSDISELELQRVAGFLNNLRDLAERSKFVIWLPPADHRESAWLNLPGVFEEYRHDGPEPHAAQTEALRLYEDVVTASESGSGALAGPGVAFVEHVRGMAERRGELGGIDLEVSYHDADWFYKAQWFYLLAFVLAAVMWLVPRSGALAWSSFGVSSVATVLVVIGIVQRCILRERPPVSTLYETILFITGCTALVCLIVEVISPRRIALSVGAALGALGMFVAYMFEMNDAKDTMPQLQAVLDTNFWLGVHVTTVTLGYAATMLAGFVAHIFVFGKLFGIRRDDKTFYRSVARMTYGVLCFATLFSTFGTISGGIWANDSWGRFWGWDPKENGALMIVLWNLLILHARMGGLVRNLGISILAIFGNSIVAFSWWGVNLMGVGLHSYGFQSGLNFWVNMFYWIQWGVAGLGVVAWAMERSRAAGGGTLPEGASTS